MEPKDLTIRKDTDGGRPLAARERIIGGQVDSVDYVLNRTYDSQDRPSGVDYSVIGADYPVKGTFLIGGCTAPGSYNSRRDALAGSLVKYGGWATISWKDLVPTVIKPGVLWSTVVSLDIDARIWAIRVATPASLALAKVV